MFKKSPKIQSNLSFVFKNAKPASDVFLQLSKTLLTDILRRTAGLKIPIIFRFRHSRRSMNMAATDKNFL